MDQRDKADEVIAAEQKRFTDEKGEWWTRKITFTAAFKIAMQLMDAPEHIKERVYMLLAKDLHCDLKDQYPERNLKDLQKEFIADCDGFLGKMFAVGDVL